MNIFEIILILIAIWTIPLKIYAVWTAVKLDQKRWFIVLLLLNTLSILELLYIFFVLKKSWVEVKADFKAGWIILKGGLKSKKVDETLKTE